MKTTVLKSLNETLGRLLETNSDVIVLGEDLVDPYGGAFKVTKGLSTRYPDRVLSTPISEGLIAGMSAGMAMRGLRPIAEIMFGDFLTLCADQLINHIAKYRWMYNDQVTLPLILRAPMGGRRGYGPTHSQTLEKFFCGVPGLRIVAVNRLSDPGRLLEQSVAASEPFLFIENKVLYPQYVYDDQTKIIGEPSLRWSAGKFPTASVSWSQFENADVTLVAYGGMSELALQAGYELMMEDELAIEVVVPTLIKPFDSKPIVDSVRRSGRLSVFEEGTESWGWGREVFYQTLRQCPELASRKAFSEGALDLPLGNARTLEDEVLPSVARIKSRLREMMKA